jgi:hypothetical protein
VQEEIQFRRRGPERLHRSGSVREFASAHDSQ